MSQDTVVKQCCNSDPIWIFVYSDGNVFVICEKDFDSPTYRYDVKKIINIKSQESFTPEEIFGA